MHYFCSALLVTSYKACNALCYFITWKVIYYLTHYNYNSSPLSMYNIYVRMYVYVCTHIKYACVYTIRWYFLQDTNFIDSKFKAYSLKISFSNFWFQLP